MTTAHLIILWGYTLIFGSGFSLAAVFLYWNIQNKERDNLWPLLFPLVVALGSLTMLLLTVEFRLGSGS